MMIYTSYSIDKVNFIKGVGKYETLFTGAPSSMKSSDGLFYVPEDCHHYLLHRPLHKELFLYQ